MTFQTRGARVCSFLREAEIILVNGGKNTGKRHVRDNATEKTVLDYSWIEKCVAEGRALLEQDGWGHCLLVDDGEDIPEDDDDQQDLLDEGDGDGADQVKTGR